MSEVSRALSVCTLGRQVLPLRPSSSQSCGRMARVPNLQSPAQGHLRRHTPRFPLVLRPAPAVHETHRGVGVPESPGGVGKKHYHYCWAERVKNRHRKGVETRKLSRGAHRILKVSSPGTEVEK